MQGVIAASAGNHALALAYHGHQMDIPVVVVMPEVAPLMKVREGREGKREGGREGGRGDRELVSVLCHRLRGVVAMVRR